MKIDIYTDTLVGSLLYLSTHTGLDTSFADGIFKLTCTQSHDATLKAGKRIRYCLEATRVLNIKKKQDNTNVPTNIDGGQELFGYTDSDWTGN